MALIQRAQKAHAKEREKVLKRQEKERQALDESARKRIDKLARNRQVIFHNFLIFLKKIQNLNLLLYRLLKVL